jgi:hypothetical protein
MWTDLNAAVSDLRRLVNDGPTDKLAYNKKVIGLANGVNLLFKTYEKRRITDFTVTPTDMTGVYLNGARLAPAGVSSDDTESGAFALASAPADGDTLTCVYYWRWFNDPELQQFVVNAIQMVLGSTDPATVVDGLIPAVLHYAGAQAYGKLAMAWTIDPAMQYMLEDAPKDKNGNAINPFIQLQKQLEAKAQELRKGYYGRNDQAEEPIFAVVSGAVRDGVPRR